MALQLFAGATKATMAKLPPPVSVSPSSELIWTEDTGRAQEAAQKAVMLGSIVATKITYNITWGVLPSGNGDTTVECFQRIMKRLKGDASLEPDLGGSFFYFGMGQDLATAKANAIVCYRSNVEYTIIEAASETYYKDISVSLIER